MALLLTGSDVICLASPSESHFRELYLMSLTLGMAFFKGRAQAYFSLKFMFDVVEQHLPPIHCYANDPQLHISFSPKVHSASWENTDTSLTVNDAWMAFKRTFMDIVDKHVPSITMRI